MKCINRLFGKEKAFLWKRNGVSLEKKRSFFGKEKEFLWKRKGVSLEKKRSFFGKEKEFLWKRNPDGTIYIYQPLRFKRLTAIYEPSSVNLRSTD